jgi:hypothetical protein
VNPARKKLNHKDAEDAERTSSSKDCLPGGNIFFSRLSGSDGQLSLYQRVGLLL